MTMSGSRFNRKAYKQSLKGLNKPLKPTKMKDLSRNSIRLKDLAKYARSQNKSILELTPSEKAMFIKA